MFVDCMHALQTTCVLTNVSPMNIADRTRFVCFRPSLAHHLFHSIKSLEQAEVSAPRVYRPICARPHHSPALRLDAVSRRSKTPTYAMLMLTATHTHVGTTTCKCCLRTPSAKQAAHTTATVHRVHTAILTQASASMVRHRPLDVPTLMCSSALRMCVARTSPSQPALEQNVGTHAKLTPTVLRCTRAKNLHVCLVRLSWLVSNLLKTSQRIAIVTLAESHGSASRFRFRAQSGCSHMWYPSWPQHHLHPHNPKLCVMPAA